MEFTCIYTLPLTPSNLEGELITPANALFHSFINHCSAVHTNSPSKLEGELITSANALFHSFINHCSSVHTNSPSKLEGARGSVFKVRNTQMRYCHYYFYTSSFCSIDEYI